MRRCCILLIPFALLAGGMGSLFKDSPVRARSRGEAAAVLQRWAREQWPQEYAAGRVRVCVLHRWDVEGQWALHIARVDGGGRVLSHDPYWVRDIGTVRFASNLMCFRDPVRPPPPPEDCVFARETYFPGGR